MAPELRPWLCTLYHVRARPLATSFSLPLPVWQQLRSYVGADLHFKLTAPGTSIKPGSRLLSVRHVDISNLDDLSRVRVTGKRLWARIADPSTGKRRLCSTSKNFLSFWQQWCLRPQFFRPLEMPRWSPEVALAADACAKGDAIGIGGWVRFGSQSPLGFQNVSGSRIFLIWACQWILRLILTSSPTKPLRRLHLLSCLARHALGAGCASPSRLGRIAVALNPFAASSSRRLCLWPFLLNVWLHLLGSLRCILMLRISLVSTTHLQTC